MQINFVKDSTLHSFLLLSGLSLHLPKTKDILVFPPQAETRGQRSFVKSLRTSFWLYVSLPTISLTSCYTVHLKSTFPFHHGYLEMTDCGENYQKEKEEKGNESQKRTITKGWENSPNGFRGKAHLKVGKTKKNKPQTPFRRPCISVECGKSEMYKQMVISVSECARNSRMSLAVI